MSALRVTFRVSLAGSGLAVLLFTAATTAAGYLVEAHHQQAERDHRLANAQAYVTHLAASLPAGLAPAEAQHVEQVLPDTLAGFGVGAQLTLISPTGKRLLYTNSGPAQQPSDKYTLPLAPDSATALALDLYPPPPNPGRRLLVALAAGLGALLADSALVFWAASRWLVGPLHRPSAQVDAIAGGDQIDTHSSSPISTRSRPGSATRPNGSRGRAPRPTRSTVS